MAATQKSHVHPTMALADGSQGAGIKRGGAASEAVEAGPGKSLPLPPPPPSKKANWGLKRYSTGSVRLHFTAKVTHKSIFLSRRV